jgi:hypothetical protein
MVSAAMSANDGRTTELVRVLAGASRWASDLGVRSTELATTIPKMTAAAIRAEKDKARLVVFCMVTVFSSARWTGWPRRTDN